MMLTLSKHVKIFSTNRALSFIFKEKKNSLISFIKGGFYLIHLYHLFVSFIWKLVFLILIWLSKNTTFNLKNYFNLKSHNFKINYICYWDMCSPENSFFSYLTHSFTYLKGALSGLKQLLATESSLKWRELFLILPSR